MERESILMYRSTRLMLKEIRAESKDNYDICMDMYQDYAFDGIEPDLDGKPLIIKLFWQAAKPLVDANNKNYLNGCKGGAPKGNKNNSSGKNQHTKPRTTEGQPKVNPRTTQGQGNVNDNANVNANDNAHVNDNANDNVNVNVNVNNKKICPFVKDGIITDWDKFQEWKRQNPDWRGEDD